MVYSCPSHLLCASTQLLQPSYRPRSTPQFCLFQGFKYQGRSSVALCSNTNSKLNVSLQDTRHSILCAVHMNAGAGHSGDRGKIDLERIVNRARKVWDSFPQPVKIFPWNKALDNFIQLILDLVLAVVKYLFVPLMAVTSISEMSYCAHERKLFLVPLPLLIGFGFATVLKETALELSPRLKNGEVPWHLIVIAAFSVLLKLPGPYYPYWGRMFIPHLANGSLLATMWFAFVWYKWRATAIGSKMLHNSLKVKSSKPKEDQMH